MGDFKPQNESEAQFVKIYDSISREISKQIRALSEDKRLPYLRAAAPNDPSLMNLYLQAMKNEDYKTCAVAKAFLLERESKFLNDIDWIICCLIDCPFTNCSNN